MATAYATPYDLVAAPAHDDLVVPAPHGDDRLATVLPFTQPAPGVSAATYRRRRLAVGTGVVLAVVLAVLGIRGVVDAVSADTTTPALPATSPVLVPIVDTVQLQPGDTLWDLAVAHTAPGEDPRVVLASIRDLNGFTGDIVPAWTVVAVPGS